MNIHEQMNDVDDDDKDDGISFKVFVLVRTCALHVVKFDNRLDFWLVNY